MNDIDPGMLNHPSNALDARPRAGGQSRYLPAFSRALLSRADQPLMKSMSLANKASNVAMSVDLSLAASLSPSWLNKNQSWPVTIPQSTMSRWMT